MFCVENQLNLLFSAISPTAPISSVINGIRGPPSQSILSSSGAKTSVKLKTSSWTQSWADSRASLPRRYIWIRCQYLHRASPVSKGSCSQRERSRRNSVSSAFHAFVSNVSAICQPITHLTRKKTQFDGIWYLDCYGPLSIWWHFQLAGPCILSEIFLNFNAPLVLIWEDVAGK